MRGALLVCIIAAFSATAAHATCPDAACDPNASRYLVRQSCTGLANCFESVGKLSGRNASCIGLTQDPSLPVGQVVQNGLTCTTNGWLWSVRRPSPTSRVAIDVGPGAFEPFVCPLGSPRLGHVTLRGAGRDQSKLLDATYFGIGIDVFGCEDLIVSELTAEGNFYGVRWIGGGEATWSRVDMIADRDHAGGGGLTAGWVDGCAAWANGDGASSTQHLYDCRAVATGKSVGPSLSYAYTANCSETYFFGGEILNTMTGPTNIHGALGVGTRASYLGSEPNRFFLFGTRVTAQPLRMQGSVGVGIDAQAGGSVQIQDGSVRVQLGVEPGRSANAIGVRELGGSQVERIATPIEAATESGSAVNEQLD